MKSGLVSAVVVAVLLLGLAIQCVGEDESSSSSSTSRPMYWFSAKPLPCDHEADKMIQAGDDTVYYNVKTHGDFTWQTANDKHALCRPDLAENERICLTFDDTDKTCEKTTEGLNYYPEGESKFENKEEVVFNGHKCFKYYDDKQMWVFWADENGTVWGYFLNFTYFAIAANYSYPEQPFSADLFTIPSDVSCEAYPKALTTPDESVFAETCVKHTSTSTSSVSSTSPVNSESPVSPSNPENPESSVKGSSSDMNMAGSTSVSSVLLLLAVLASLLVF